MTTRTHKFFVIQTSNGFVGTQTIGDLNDSQPFAFAYTYETEAEAAAIAAAFQGASVVSANYDGPVT